MPSPGSTPLDWWMFGGGAGHRGYVAKSNINSTNVKDGLKICHTVELGGPILAVPAIVGDFVYVGVANSHAASGSNGGAFHKVNVQTGVIEHTFTWEIPIGERDSHGFTGMGCTPSVVDGRVTFSAFNGKVYCLSADDLSELWITDLRYTDDSHSQPITNIGGVDDGYAQAAGWSSPLAVDDRVYVGLGEGENPQLYSFIYCLDQSTGNVQWIYCTCRYEQGRNNAPNVLPASVVKGQLPAGYTLFESEPLSRGCSVWSAIAYEPTLDRIYAATGNPVPDNTLPKQSGLYSSGILSLDAKTGEFRGFVQIPADSSYRPSDMDVDIAGSPSVFELDGRKVVGVGCKNGCYMIVDADSLDVIASRQLLPRMNNGDQIPTVDPHVPPESTERNPQVSNADSNATEGENFSGTYSCGAFDPVTKRIFIGIGGSNDNLVSPGIDSPNVPFMRALQADSPRLEDAWPLDDGDPRRYSKPRPPMYTTAAECGLGYPTVVNDVVLCSTTKVALYAFSVSDGTSLWEDHIGEQTDGLNGGYGFCFGAAVRGDVVVAGGLVYGRDGGILRIYKLEEGTQ